MEENFINKQTHTLNTNSLFVNVNGEYSRKKMREQLIFIRPLGRGRGATSAADHRGRFLSAPLAVSTSYRGVEEGKFQKQHASVRAPAEMLPMQCAHAR